MLTMSLQKKLITVSMAILLFVAFASYAFAKDGTETGGMVLSTSSEEIISVVLPTIGEQSPFDFYVDPQALIYKTGASMYGGGRVEEDAYLLFQNHSDGEFDFSRYSDKLTVTNKSTVPVNLTIRAAISDLDNVRLAGEYDFSDDTDCAIYLALMDDEGNEIPLLKDEEISLTAEIKRAPEGVYTWAYNEESGRYEYEYSADSETEFDSYSFGLHGECNERADWKDVFVSTMVTVTWSFEPVMEEDLDQDYEEESFDQESPLEDEALSVETALEDADEDGLESEGEQEIPEITVEQDMNPK